MSFQAVIPTGGIVGWRFLQRTQEAQMDAFAKAPQAQRDRDYFLENIGKVKTAADLVADRRLLGVALGAFGLQDDLPNKFFIQKILQDGTRDGAALANRLADRRYARLAEAFRFGPGEVPQTGNPGAMERIADRHQRQAFEISVGESDENLRIALYAQRELTEIAASKMSDEGKWFTIMGLPPLRSMFETALGLPKAFGQVDIDQQLSVFREKTSALTGQSGVDQFTDPEALERLTNLYLARSQINAASSGLSSGSVALSLLQSL